MSQLLYGDCLQLLPSLPDKSIDLVVCDLPYGQTKNKWDSVIPLGPLWDQYRRVCKDKTPIILFGQDKFTARVMLSNEAWHRYNLIWEKTQPTGFLNSKKMPLRAHEDIMVFYKELPVYNPIMGKGVRKVSSAVHQRNSKETSSYGKYGSHDYDSTARYPRSVMKYAKDTQKAALHPTQKPLALVRDLILMYSRQGDTVLDNACGSGTTGAACSVTDRTYILIDNDIHSINKSAERLGVTFSTQFT